MQLPDVCSGSTPHLLLGSWAMYSVIRQLFIIKQILDKTCIVLKCAVLFDVLSVDTLMETAV